MKKYRILVVDDDYEIRNAVLRLLEGEGYTAAGAASGREASGYVRSYIQLSDFRHHDAGKGWHKYLH